MLRTDFFSKDFFSNGHIQDIQLKWTILRCYNTFWRISSFPKKLKILF